MSEVVKIEEASKILGMSRQTIHIRMERNLFEPPIGRCIRSLNGDKIYHYIYRDMLNRFIGKE